MSLLSRDPKCGACSHSWHLLICEDHGCPCDHPPVPGVYNEEPT